MYMHRPVHAYIYIYIYSLCGYMRAGTHGKRNTRNTKEAKKSSGTPLALNWGPASASAIRTCGQLGITNCSTAGRPVSRSWSICQ